MLKWKIDNKRLEKTVTKIVKKYEIIEIKDTKETVVIPPKEEIPITDYYFDFIKMNLIDIDISKIQNDYENVKGWIKVEGTNVNYPFVQGNDNDYYLHHSIDKTYNSAGWIFLDYRNNFGNDKNTILFGHGRRNLTMFGSLNNILYDNAWLKNKDNFVIKISTEKENSLWQIFSAYHLRTTSDYLKINFDSDEEYQDFLDLIKGRSMFDFNTSVSVSDNILTLSTCFNDEDEKMVIHAKLIKKDLK